MKSSIPHKIICNANRSQTKVSTFAITLFNLPTKQKAFSNASVAIMVNIGEVPNSMNFWANLYLFGQFFISTVSTTFSQQILYEKLLLILI